MSDESAKALVSDGNARQPVIVNVSAVPTGQLYIPDKWVFGGNLQTRRLYPDYSFLIVHPSGKSLMFDLGIRKVGAHFHLFIFLKVRILRIIRDVYEKISSILARQLRKALAKYYLKLASISGR